MCTLLADHKATLNTLAGLIRDAKDCAAKIYTEGSYADNVKNFLDRAAAAADEEFIVLIIGNFVSGKTSMINALIGEELLPTSFLPEIAVLGELHYGTKKRITLYPKKGKWENGDEPFDLREVTVDEIRKYVSLSTDDAINSMEQNDEDPASDAGINAKFEKMVVFWPLDILKDGVVLVDSPGINDPYSNDYIVNDYLPKADAVVYVMSAVNAYTGLDKTQLETINALGRRDIVTAYTFYDIVEQHTRRNPARLISIRNKLTDYVMRHTNLGEASIHFLDSPGGLDAKINGDSEAWRKSGFAGFEDYLGQYLVEGKGTDQVRNIVYMIFSQANFMIADAKRFNAAEIAEAEQHLQSVRERNLTFARKYRQHFENRLPEVEQLIRTFLTEELPTRINLDNFQPEATLPTGIEQLNPFAGRQKAQALRYECQCEILRRMNLEYKKWATSTLTHYIQSPMQKSPQGNCLPSEPFTVGKLPFPEYVFELIPYARFKIIAKNVNSLEKIKFLVVKYAAEFFNDPAFRVDVDGIIDNIMTDIRAYVDNLCTGTEKILHSEVTQAEQVVCQMLEDGNADSVTKNALISQRNAAVDKLSSIKAAAFQIGRDCGIF